MKKSSKQLILQILGGLVSIFLLIPLVAGCGGVEMEIETVVESSGELNFKFTLVVDEEIAQSINLEDIEGFFEVESLTINIEQEGNDILYTYKLDDRWDNYLDIGFFDEQKATINNLDLQVNDSFITRDFYLEFSLSANDVSLTEDKIIAEFEGVESEFSELGLDDIGLDGIGLDLFASLFSINSVFSMPGDIIESNADHIEGNSAYWNIDIFSIETDQTFSVHSRVINWGAVGGISGIVFLMIIFAALIVTRRKRGALTSGVGEETNFTPVDLSGDNKATSKGNNDKFGG